MENFKITETTNAHGAKIVVIGVGGGGGNMINHLKESGLSDEVKLVAANTDIQALEHCDADLKIQLGPETCRGLGSGMKPEVGRDAAIESQDEIRAALTSE